MNISHLFFSLHYKSKNSFWFPKIMSFNNYTHLFLIGSWHKGRMCVGRRWWWWRTGNQFSLVWPAKMKVKSLAWLTTVSYFNKGRRGGMPSKYSGAERTETIVTCLHLACLSLRVWPRNVKLGVDACKLPGPSRDHLFKQSHDYRIREGQRQKGDTKETVWKWTHFLFLQGSPKVNGELLPVFKELGLLWSR